MAIDPAIGIGRAATALALEIPRNINGVPFDGTADIVLIPRVATPIASSATPAINVDLYNNLSITALAVAITGFTITGTINNFHRLLVRIKDNGTARAITWGSSFEAGAVALPTTTVAGKTLLVGFIGDSVDAKFACEASGSRP